MLVSAGFDSEGIVVDATHPYAADVTGNIRAAAKQASDNIIRAAEIEAKRRLEDAAQKVREAVTEYERIVSEKRQFIAKMRNTLKTELSLLEDAEQQFPDKQESDVLKEVNIEIGTKPEDVQELEAADEVASEENE